MESPRLTVNGALVRRTRKKRGLEIADVAARVGISRSYLSRIEVRSLRLTPSTYKALCAALNCDYDDLLAMGEDEPKEEE